MKRCAVFLLLCLLSCLVACASEVSLDEPAVETRTPPPATNTPRPTDTPLPTNTSTSTPTPAPSATPSSTPTPSPLSSSEIFNRVSPSVAFVETEISRGSGVLLEGGMILTNAHVVWPYDQARVLFADGSTYERVPVANWDLLVDLAVLGPIDTEVPAVEISDTEDLAVGSEVYLLGYPGEVDAEPQPAITRGLISRIREWEPKGITFFQTDAMVGGGQSGGIMVTEYGEVLGISTFIFGDAGFALVASGADIQQRVEDLIAGEDTAGLKVRRLPAEEGRRLYTSIDLAHEWDRETYVVREPIGTEVEITAEGGRNDLAITVYDVFGQEITYVDQGYAGQETAEFSVQVDAPYFVTLAQYSWAAYDPMSIQSSSRLHRMPDLDDGRGLLEGSTYMGNIDYPQDFDYYQLVLTEGDKINMVVRSISIDPVLLIGQAGEPLERFLVDNNSGGGMLGFDAEMSFIAPDSGNYLLVVGDSSGFGRGGYILEVREVYNGAPTPMVPLPTPEAIASELGPMAIYFSERGDLSFLYPYEWSTATVSSSWWETLCEGATSCIGGDDGLLVVAEESLAGLPIEDFAEYVALYRSFLEEGNVELLSEMDFVSDLGLRGKVLHFDLFGLFEAKRFMVPYGDLVFNITYVTDLDNADEFWRLADFSFSSLAEVD